ncbi:MAG: cistern family PEP-CTERM protein [Sphingomonas sp.]|nr:cistern family PEP-CTERM protein [Sphingomonas sp.]
MCDTAQAFSGDDCNRAVATTIGWDVGGFAMKSIRSIKVMFAAALAAFTMTPAMSAVVLNTTNSGYQFNVNYAGLVGGVSTTNVSALQNLTFAGITNSGKTYNFNYTLTNNSIYDSRISSFGFNLASAATIASLSATGAYPYPDQDNNYPEGIGNIEICFTEGTSGHCTGNGGGLTSNPDEVGTGTFALTLTQAMSSISLDDFTVRYQAISPTVNGSSSGVGVGTVSDVGGGIGGVVSAAPEPMTWAMMIGGFMLIGMALRRRPEQDMLLAA